ncbi:MAG: SoxR reducing system RseC family protein [bacterium]
MEISGVVSGLEGDRARVSVPDEDSGGEIELLAANPVGAGEGSRVKLFMPDAADEVVMGLVYFLPLGGAIGGALAGAGVARIEFFSSLLRSLGGRFAGPVISSGHNLAMAGAGAGLVIALFAAGAWIKKRKRSCRQRAEILAVLE